MSLSCNADRIVCIGCLHRVVSGKLLLRLGKRPIRGHGFAVSDTDCAIAVKAAVSELSLAAGQPTTNETPELTPLV